MRDLAGLDGCGLASEQSLRMRASDEAIRPLSQLADCFVEPVIRRRLDRRYRAVARGRDAGALAHRCFFATFLFLVVVFLAFAGAFFLAAAIFLGRTGLFATAFFLNTGGLFGFARPVTATVRPGPLAGTDVDARLDIA